MRVLWTHTFDPSDALAGSFMMTARAALHSVGIEPTLHYLGKLQTPFQLRKVIEELALKASGYDVVHAQYGSGCGFVTSTVQTVPTVLTLRGSDWHLPPSRNVRERIHHLVGVGLTRLAIRRVDQTICVSQRMASQVSRTRLERKPRVLIDPVDAGSFPQLDRRRARRRLGLQVDGVKFVLFSATEADIPVKRIWLAQEAMEIVKAGNPEVELLIASQLPRNVMPLMVAASDVALSTSYSEGWPNCIKEAMVHGLPFVATDVSDLAKVAREQSCCFVVDDEPSVLAAAIERALKIDERVDYGPVLSQMTPEYFALQLKEIYADVANASHRSTDSR